MLLLLLFSVVPFYAASVRGSDLNDDAFISLTFAKNLALGNGFVYNHAPAVFGTTTPLWTLLMALLGVVFGVELLPQLAVWTSAICWLALGWLIYLCRVSFGLTRAMAVIIALLLMTAQYPYLGAETNLYQFLFFAMLAAAFNNLALAAGVLGGLLFLTRGEGALAFALVATWMVLRGSDKDLAPRIHKSLRVAAGFALTVLPWSMYAYTQFGHVLPQTMRAKILQGELPGATLFHEGLWQAMGEWATGDPFGIPAALIYWPLFASGLVWAIARQRRLLLIALWGALYVAAYSLLRVAYYWWYHLPAYWVWLFFVALGAAYVWRTPHKIKSGMQRRLNRGLNVAVLAIIWFSRVDHCVMLAGDQADFRAPTYRAISVWLNENASTDATLGVVEAGYFGYHTDLKILDSSGLVQRNAMLYIKEGIAALVRDYDPDFCAIPAWPAAVEVLGTVEAEMKAAGYEEVARFGPPEALGILFRKRGG